MTGTSCLFDTAPAGSIELSVLATGADKSTVGILTRSSLTRAVVTFINVFTNPLDNVIFITLVTHTAVRPSCVFTLSVQTDIFTFTLVQVNTRLAIVGPFKSNVTDTLVVTDDVCAAAVLTLFTAGCALVNVDTLLASLRDVGREPRFTATLP